MENNFRNIFGLRKYSWVMLKFAFTKEWINVHWKTLNFSNVTPKHTPLNVKNHFKTHRHKNYKRLMPKIASKVSLPCRTQKSMITIQLHRVTILHKNKQSVQKVNSRFRNKNWNRNRFRRLDILFLFNLHKRLPKQTRSPVCVSLEVCAAHKPRISSIGWNLSNEDDMPHTTMFHCENVTRISSSVA